MTAAPDRIAVRGLRAWGRHGVFPAERAAGQPFVVDLVLDVDVRAASASDDLADAVDYGAVAGEAIRLVEGQPVNLIETLAARIAERCLSRAGVRAVEVTVHKPEAPIAAPFDDVTVTIRRSCA